jgi:glycosyl-4,4'-diaponeurosporenoate acyltransferase
MTLLVGGITTRRNLVIVLIDAVVWVVWSVTSGYIAHRLPLSRLQRDEGLLRLRPPERRFYVRVCRIKRWKDKLPEGGDIFPGGYNKSHLRGRDVAALARFAAETRRAEITHWLIMAAGPVFLLWNPWWLGMIMLAYAVIANLPCLIVQRYNRARLLRLIPADATVVDRPAVDRN